MKKFRTINVLKVKELFITGQSKFTHDRSLYLQTNY